MTLLFLLGLAPLASTGCGIFGPSDNIDDDFSDALEVKTANIYAFNVDSNGGVTVKITALSNQNAILGIWVGQFVGAECRPIIGMHQFAATLNREAINSPINKGDYCLQVYDPGGLTASVNYTVRVTHP